MTAAERRRPEVAKAIRTALPHLQHLVNMLEIGVNCPDPESCRSTVGTLGRVAARLDAELAALAGSPARRASP